MNVLKGNDNSSAATSIFQTLFIFLESNNAARQPPLHRKDSSTAGS